MLSKRGLQKMKSNHPWLTADDLSNKLKLPRHPGIVALEGHWWLHSPASFIKLRRFGPALASHGLHPEFSKPKGKEYGNLELSKFRGLFAPWITLHLQNTLVKKLAALELQLDQEDPAFRWVFSENDFFPGLIVDVFGDILVAQLNAAPVETLWFEIRPALLNAYKNHFGREATLMELRTSSVRTKEGLDIIAPELAAEEKIIRWNGLKWVMSPGGAQKTGSYFDQRTNHTAAAQFAKGLGVKNAWDLCSYQGGFALQLLKAGVNHVLAVDQSADALATLQKNAGLNDFAPEEITTVKSDIFDFLKSDVGAGTDHPDFIVLDPPSFVKARQAVPQALKGLQELNQLALQKIKAGGGLVTCVCSHHIGEPNFLKIVHAAAIQAKRNIQVVKKLGPAIDHAPLKEFPEGRYLQAIFVKVEN